MRNSNLEINPSAMALLKAENMHLRYSAMTAGIDCNENRHPQLVMKELGITYQHATPQSIADQWWFWNCEHVPVVLPKYLTPLVLDPLKQVGNGLSQSEAEKIASYGRLP